MKITIKEKRRNAQTWKCVEFRSWYDMKPLSSEWFSVPRAKTEERRPARSRSVVLSAGGFSVSVCVVSASSSPLCLHHGWLRVKVLSSPPDRRSRRSSSHHALVVFAGVDLTEIPVLLWRWKVFNRVEVKLGFKIIYDGLGGGDGGVAVPNGRGRGRGSSWGSWG